MSMALATRLPVTRASACSRHRAIQGLGTPSPPGSELAHTKPSAVASMKLSSERANSTQLGGGRSWKVPFQGPEEWCNGAAAPGFFECSPTLEAFIDNAVV